MRISFRLIAGVSMALSVTACGGDSPSSATSPEIASEPSVRSNSIVESSGFYWSADSNAYLWDGEPPSGDLDPARITEAYTFSTVPKNGGGGKVEGRANFREADQWRMQIVYSVWLDNGRHQLYNNSQRDSDWQWCPVRGSYECYQKGISQFFNAIRVDCGARVEAGGTAWAKKRLPFALQLGLSVKRIFSPGYTWDPEWGHATEPLVASTDRSAKDCPPPKPFMYMTDGGEASNTRLEFRGARGITFSDRSESFTEGEHTCEWFVNGTSTSTACSGFTSTMAVGSHNVSLTVTDGASQTASVSGSVLIEEPCTTPTDTLAADPVANDGVERLPGTRAAVIEPCGFTTPPGQGGGEGPTQAPGGGPITPDCGWYRDIVIWENGSWAWLGSWYYQCEYAELGILNDRHESPSTRTTVVLSGANSLTSGRSVEVERRRGENALRVSVNLRSVTPIDVAHALLGAERMLRQPWPNKASAAVRLLPTLSSLVVGAESPAFRQAVRILSELRAQGTPASSRHGSATTVNVHVDATSTRSLTGTPRETMQR